MINTFEKPRLRASASSSLVALLLFVVGLHACASAPRAAQNGGSGYGAPVRLADLEHQAITESSGIAASRRNENVLWTHNDSGDGPLIYAFDRNGKHLGAWKVAGARARDWEDIAVGPGPTKGQSYIYVGDIGDNSGSRDEIIVYRVAEPAVDPKAPPSTRDTQPADVLRLKYPDGAHNAEALLVHPSTGDLYIVVKVMGGAAGVYKTSAPISTSARSTLARVGEVQFSNPFRGLITGGDISPDGRRVVLCDYLVACELTLPETGGVAFDEIWKQPLTPINVGSRRQGEAICYRADGKALLVTSEGSPCPLIEVPSK